MSRPSSDGAAACVINYAGVLTTRDSAALSVVRTTARAAERAWTRAKETRHSSQTLLPLQPAGLPPPLSRRDASHCTAAQQTARRCRESTTMEALLSTGLQRRPLPPRAAARSRPASGPVASSSACDRHHELAAPAARPTHDAAAPSECVEHAQHAPRLRSVNSGAFLAYSAPGRETGAEGARQGSNCSAHASHPSTRRPDVTFTFQPVRAKVPFRRHHRLTHGGSEKPPS